jgi:hypothetical protein
VREPFAAKVVRRLLAKDAVKAIWGKASAEARRGMGWAEPDPEYWQRIPAAAKTIPPDWSALPVVRFTNTDVGGLREVRLRQGPEYDQWLLRDPLRHLTACISVHRRSRRVYFMEVQRRSDGQWGLRVAADQCYSCHPSGPRVIRPFNEPQIDRPTLAAFNRRILSYGACDFGPELDDGLRWQPLDHSSCAGCHDGVRRGRLDAVHRRAIRFKIEREETMPPSYEPGSPSR